MFQWPSWSENIQSLKFSNMTFQADFILSLCKIWNKIAMSFIRIRSVIISNMRLRRFREDLVAVNTSEQSFGGEWDNCRKRFANYSDCKYKWSAIICIKEYECSCCISEEFRNRIEEMTLIYTLWEKQIYHNNILFPCPSTSNPNIHSSS